MLSLRRWLPLWAGVLLFSSMSYAAELSAPGQSASRPAASTITDIDDCQPAVQNSPYIPVDSWIYPAVMRLYSLGYVDAVYLGMRPWTRSALISMLDEVDSRLDDDDTGSAAEEATRLDQALMAELRQDIQEPCARAAGTLHIESGYSVLRGINGTPLRDSYHLGSTIINDYGRPYAGGVNNYSGLSGYASAGRLLLYVRGEFQVAPSTAGYLNTLAGNLAALDGTTFAFNANCWAYETSCIPLPYNQQATFPAGPIAAKADARLIEAYVSAKVLYHEVSFGKQDNWLGPGVGGGMAYSNNAENIYSFRINRTEPLRIPLLSNVTGPFRYDFVVGPLKGHTYPTNPWMHVEKISFKPTPNLEVGFERTVIWGGKGHSPITIRSFLRSFFSFSAPTSIAIKDGPLDPGARFGAFDFSYRIPLARNWLTLYSDSEVHDDVSPIDAPRRAAIRPGLYLSHVPHFPKLDVRVEAVSTDPRVASSKGGHFMYYEGIQRQGYTNKGAMIGDWIGREAKGGQGWITYHLSGNEWLQLGIRNQKAAKDFIPGGTTLNDIDFQVVKRIGKDFEINGTFALEHWKAPIYSSGQHTVATTNIQLTWFPGRKISF